MHHQLWQTELLDDSLERLLQAYTESVGGTCGGTPAELIAGASKIAKEHGPVHAHGPADCTCASDTEDKDAEGENAEALDEGDNCGAAIDGGADDITPLKLWDTIMKKYKVAQIAEQELKRLDAQEKKKDQTEAAFLQRQLAEATAAAVDALAKLNHQETRRKLEELFDSERGRPAGLVIDYASEFLSSRDPLFWFSCFVRLFPRGDCMERCMQRPTRTVSWRWAKCLLTRHDFSLWRQDTHPRVKLSRGGGVWV